MQKKIEKRCLKKQMKLRLGVFNKLKWALIEGPSGRKFLIYVVNPRNDYGQTVLFRAVTKLRSCQQRLLKRTVIVSGSAPYWGKGAFGRCGHGDTGFGKYRLWAAGQRQHRQWCSIYRLAAATERAVLLEEYSSVSHVELRHGHCDFFELTGFERDLG